MRILRWVFCWSLLLADVTTAQQKQKTDAEQDGFQGPIRSVSTQIDQAKVNWQQPSGPSLVWPIYCRVCEYDPDGTRTKNGQITPDGEYIGEDIKIVRDEAGHVIERTRIGSDGKVFEQEKDGPFGPVENIYPHGPIARTTRSYDSLGHLSEVLSFDAAGQQVSRSAIRTNPDGQWTEHADWGKTGQLTYRETYDPDTDFQRFESYDDSGVVKIAFTFSHNKVQTFWAATGEPNQFGSGVTANKGNGDIDDFSCHKGGECDVSHVHYTYADSTKENPTSVEWRNSEGVLLYAAYYQYEFDEHHNWTKRTIWVLSPEIPQPTPYEADIRTIAYWL
jgi:hypothetical protein